jgi:hypothetical protein
MFSSVCALPSPASAEGCLPFVVRLVYWYYGSVRLLLYVHVRRSVHGSLPIITLLRFHYSVWSIANWQSGQVRRCWCSYRVLSSIQAAPSVTLP